MKIRALIGICWPLLASLMLAPGVSAAADANASSSVECPSSADITPTHLYGRWTLTLGTPEKPEGTGTVVFERHPEYAGSVRGTFERNTDAGPYKALVAGDVTNQGFQLEESVDGVNIDAVWSGDVSLSSCGREIQGWRRVVEGHTSKEPEIELPFTLQKTPGWR